MEDNKPLRLTKARKASLALARKTVSDLTPWLKPDQRYVLIKHAAFLMKYYNQKNVYRAPTEAFTPENYKAIDASFNRLMKLRRGSLGTHKSINKEKLKVFVEVMMNSAVIAMLSDHY